MTWSDGKTRQRRLILLAGLERPGEGAHGRLVACPTYTWVQPPARHEARGVVYAVISTLGR